MDDAHAGGGLKEADRLMRQGVADGVFPGGVLLVARHGALCFENAYGVADLRSGRPVTTDTLFDLASLTKPLATTLAVMRLVATDRLCLDAPVSLVLDGFSAGGKAAITPRDLLLHRSGLPDYRPYYHRLARIPFHDRLKQRAGYLVNEPLACSPGRRTICSDLGFMVLRTAVEEVSGMRIDRLLQRDIYGPLGIDDLFYVDLAAPREIGAEFAATEDCPWRNGVLCGQVHDENAWTVGGIDGHAGLFGSASAVHRLLGALVAAWDGHGGSGVFDPRWVRLFFEKDRDAGRALGFDCPAAEASSSGCRFSESSIGHLGFTGTSFWVDLAAGIWVVLLTNRVHPTRANEKIRRFRPALLDAVRNALA